MKKYIITLVTIVALVLIPLYCYKQSRPKYRHIRPHAKLLKETWVWLYDSAIYKQSGHYLRIYRKYDYKYSDSIMVGKLIRDYTIMNYATTYRGDTVFMEFIDLTNYPHRED